MFDDWQAKRDVEAFNGCVLGFLIFAFYLFVVGVIGSWILNWVLSGVGATFRLEWWHVSLIWVVLRLLR